MDIVTKVETTKLTSKEAVVAWYKTKLSKDAGWAIAGLMRVYANQTKDEQSGGYVAYNNGVGFVHTDAELLTFLAHQYEKKHSLSEKQIEVLFKKMPKYARQLMNYSIASGKMAKIDGVYQIVKYSK